MRAQLASLQGAVDEGADGGLFVGGVVGERFEAHHLWSVVVFGSLSKA